MMTQRLRQCNLAVVSLVISAAHLSLPATSAFAFPAAVKSTTRSLTSHHRGNCRTYSSSSSALKMSTLNIQWFRQTDLRLHDNPALCRTVDLSLGKAEKQPVGAAPTTKAKPTGILPVFVFDTERIYGSDTRSELGCMKCGPRRAQFVLEAVADLRANLEKRGSGLIVAVGKPEKVLAEIADAASATSLNVVCQEEVCSEELAVDKAVRSELAKKMKKGGKFNYETVWGSTMYDPDSLPFDGEVFGIPDTFTPFRNKVEKACNIGQPLDIPKDEHLTLPKDIKSVVKQPKCSLSFMPTLADLGYKAEDIESVESVDSRSAMPAKYKGGETFALARVKDYIWDKDLLKIYFDTRNGMIGSDYSTKVSFLNCAWS